MVVSGLLCGELSVLVGYLGEASRKLAYFIQTATLLVSQNTPLLWEFCFTNLLIESVVSLVTD